MILRRRRWMLTIPAPSQWLIWAVLLPWSMALLFVECGPRLRTRAQIPVVEKQEHCALDRVPQLHEIVKWVHADQNLVVRQMEIEGQLTCYRVELEDGQMGWVPWHRGFLESSGVDVRWTFGH